jgi:hypothetical protein
MEKERGVFELRSPQDLVAKLRFDFKRLEADPLDQYAAFDFFVTAAHLPDWLAPGLDQAAKDKRTEIRARNILLQVCDHIASGSKHFEASAKHHTSVARTETHHGGFSREFSRAFEISELTVHLQGDAAKELGESVDALDLARQVLDYWQRDLCI